MSILLTFLVIGVIATAHELGHFFAARREGIPVRELSLGVGPKILQKDKNGTKFSLRLIPIFAYVQMAGVLPEEQDMEDGYLRKRPGQKARVLVAGSLMNVFLAMVIFIGLFMGMGVYSEEPVLGDVYEGSPAMEAGFLPGDRIVSIGGENVDSWTSMIGLIGESGGIPLEISVQRDNSTLVLQVTPVTDPESGRALIGIEKSRVRLNPLQAVIQGVWQSVSFIGLMLVSLGMMISGAAPAELSGPVGIASMVGQASTGGLAGILNFTAILSLNLAILNMLPIPALDGGKLVLVLVEKIRGKRLSLEKEVTINLVGFAILIGIMLLATYNDVLSLFR